MQITSPVFVFLFLPLTLPVMPLCPKKYRKVAMALLSLSFFLLANLPNPLAYAQIGAVLLLVCALLCPPTEVLLRVRMLLGICLPVAAFLAARILTELFPQAYVYPFGLGLVTLGAVSLCVDRDRGDVIERETPLSVIGYLLFFPTITLGPVLRYKQYLYLCERNTPSLERFSEGALLYMKGFLKRIAVGSVLFAALRALLDAAPQNTFPLSALLVALFLAFFALYFTVCGITDMSRGLLGLYGFFPVRGQGRVFDNVAPHRMLGGLLCSLDAFCEDYVAGPIRRVLPNKWGKCLAALAVCSCTLLFYRTHPALLLVGLPLLLASVLCAEHSKYVRTPKRALLRVPLALCSAFFLSLFALALMLEDPFSLFGLFSGVWQQTDALTLYRVLMSFPYRNYLILMLFLAAVGMPLAYFAKPISQKLPQRARTALHFLGVLLLFLAFLLCLIFLLPQFPQYAELAYHKILF